MKNLKIALIITTIIAVVNTLITLWGNIQYNKLNDKYYQLNRDHRRLLRKTEIRKNATNAYAKNEYVRDSHRKAFADGLNAISKLNLEQFGISDDGKFMDKIKKGADTSKDDIE